MAFDALRGVGVRPPRMPLVDGVMHGEPLLDPVAAQELSVAWRNHRDPYRGVTTDGVVRPGLYQLTDTGISARDAVDAAQHFLTLLTENERLVAQLAVDADDWRLWTNAYPMWNAKGLRLERISADKAEAALATLRASLSDEGYAMARNAMRLNGALGELTGVYQETLTEFAYQFTIFGEPGATTPWGWQLMGHHLDLNCVFVGSQMVLAPMFVGAEPNFAFTGQYAGTRVLDHETQRGLDLRRSLTQTQEDQFLQGESLLSKDLPDELGGRFNGRHLSGAGQDNLVLPYEGIRGTDLAPDQQKLLLDLLDLLDVYVNRLPARHARLKRRHIEDHFAETHFVWRGGHGDTSAFYYRVHSPVLLVEYDNHPGIFLDNDEPEPFHIHTIVREPNGNDYGKDLMAQHYALHHAGPTTAEGSQR